MNLYAMCAEDPCVVIGCQLEYGHDGQHETAAQAAERTCAAHILRALLDAPDAVRLNALATACRVFIENRLPQPPNPPVIVGAPLGGDSNGGER